MPKALQTQLSAILQADTFQSNLIQELVAAIEQLNRSDDVSTINKGLRSSLLQLNDIYDAKLSELNELEENLEQLTQMLAQSKAGLHTNENNLLRNIVSAFTHVGSGRRNLLPFMNEASPAPSPTQPTHKAHRRVLQHHHHHRPSHSQVLLRGTKWISGRRSTGSGPFRGNSATKSRALVSAASSRSRIAAQQRRNQAIEALRSRSRKENSPSSSSSSSQESKSAAVGQRSRSNSSPAARRKRESEDGERLYCLCKKVSHGEMIACDNSRCDIEWFHFACVDIRVQPKGRWYCPRCRGYNSKVKKTDA